MPSGRARGLGGFTLIELLVTLAILALLLTIAAPRYFHSVDVAKEAVLRENLRVTRDALDKFKADLGRYPDSLQELVNQRYLATLPIDPMTGSTATWQILPPVDASKGVVADLRSGADGAGRNGLPFREW